MPTPLKPEDFAKAGSEHAHQVTGELVKGDVYNASRTAFRHARIAAGLCRDCGKVPPVENKTICASCFERRRQDNSARTKRKVAEGLCLQCGQSHDRKTKFCQKCMNNQVQACRERRKRNKVVVLAHFGTRCVDCGVCDVRVLTLDHVNGDGSIDRKGKTSVDWYAVLYSLIVSEQKLPCELVCRCFNCHAIKDLCPWWLR